MLKYISAGGPVMYPIILCSVVGLAVSIQKIIQLVLMPTGSDQLMRSVKVNMSQGRPVEAMQAAKAAKGPVAGLARAAVSNYGRPYNEIKDAIEMAGREETRNGEEDERPGRHRHSCASSRPSWHGRWPDQELSGFVGVRRAYYAGPAVRRDRRGDDNHRGRPHSRSAAHAGVQLAFGGH